MRLISETLFGSSKKGEILPLYAFLLCLAVALFFRAPFFFESVVSWDESTYILMAQALLDGDLPFTNFWELKPPLLYAAYTIPIALFGKSIIAIRLFGAILLAIVAFFVFRLSSRFVSHRLALMVSCLVVAATTSIPGGQATLSEHMAILPLTWSMALAATTAMTPRRAFWIGCLVSAACLIRTNLGVVAICGGLLMLFYYDYENLRKNLTCTLSYIVGGLLILVIILIPYFVSDNQLAFWDAVVVMPLNYSDSQYGIFGAAVRQMAHSIGLYVWKSELIYVQAASGFAIWPAAVGGAGLLLANWQGLEKLERNVLLVSSVYFVGVGLSIVMGGKAHAHYLIQLVPSAAVLAALTYRTAARHLRRPFVPAGFAVAVTAVLVFSSMGSYSAAIERRADTGRTITGASVEIAGFLKDRCGGRPSLFLLTDHILYWFMDAWPPIRPMHPSIIGKEYLLETIYGRRTTSEEELARAFSSRPDYVVKSERVWYLNNHAAALEFLHGTLKAEYSLIATIKGRMIYERNGVECPR